MLETKPIRVLLVDDHAVVRSGLSAFLTVYDDLELAGEARDGAEAVRLCKQVHPDVVLMDLVMPELDGATATRQIRQACPHTQVIVLTSFREDELVQGALQAGAIGYLLKNVAADELARAIRAAAAGRATLAPEAAQALIHAATQPPAPGFYLTEREREVLQRVASGRPNKLIADELGISVRTVEVHRARVFEKMDVKSAVELAQLLQQI